METITEWRYVSRLIYRRSTPDSERLDDDDDDDIVCGFSS